MPARPLHAETQAILAQLDHHRTVYARRHHTPPGRRAVVSAVDKAAGLGRNNLTEAISGRTALTVEKLIGVLHALKVEPAVFFAEALGPAELDAAKLLLEIEEEHPADVASLAELRAFEPLPAPEEEEGSAPAELLARLELWEGERVLDPNGALAAAMALFEEAHALASGTPHRCHVAVLCRCLGAVGSALRVRGRFGVAARCLWLELTHARRHGLRGAEADALQRAAYLFSNKGLKPAAAAAAHAALDRFFREDERSEAGKALITCGEMLRRAGRGEEAATAFRDGLRLLPGGVWWGRVTAHLGNVLIAVPLGRTAHAERELARAREAIGGRQGAVWYRVEWITGEIALARGEEDRALTHFELAKEGMRHPIEHGLVALRQSLALFRLGRHAELRELGAEMVGLLAPLARERLAASVLGEIARALVGGKLREQLLEQETLRLWKGYAGLEAYPLHPPRAS